MERVIGNLLTDRRYNVSMKSFNGDINLIGEGLTSLKGFPKYVNGSVNLSKNNLTSLAYGPDRTDLSFIITDNLQLTTLDYLPKQIFGFVVNTYGSPIIDISYVINCDIPPLLITYQEDLALLPIIHCGVEFDPIMLDLQEIIKKYSRSKPTKVDFVDFQFDLMTHGYATNARWKP